MFYNQTTYSTVASSEPYFLSAVDVNGDNKSDIVVANSNTNNLGVLLNGGNGTFLAQTVYATGPGTAPFSVVAIDVNGDNKPDLIAANSGSDNVGVRLNNGAGVFLAQTTYTTGANSNPRALALADLNGDNKSDIVVANNDGNTVGVLLNSGTGTFPTQTTYTTGANSNPRGVALADLNGDNKPDIVVANNNGNTVGVLFNSGTGTFLAQTTYTTGTGSGPRTVTLADVNDDDKIDIIVANTDTNNVGVFINRGNGTFLAQTTYTVGTGPRGVTTADVNNDNKIDIIIANSAGNTVGVLLNGGNGTFLAQTTFSTGTGSTPYAVTTADVNNDNKPDIVVANFGGDTVGVLLHC